ncbi:hypothetical protein CGCFRS4_v015191 [Colletotrichum fructicola]|uniref:Uncharacterized protein n=2 Tax=Colletotrichum fructicola (strain Nara gc5) TaxID=1213859 RepID=L2GGC4_COLFN|nr:hypothetical protein CGCFRS4_v015191 [Colletotrichum fructicola]
MSFQFEGDLFDRYWTCRFLQADRPGKKQLRRYAEKIVRSDHGRWEEDVDDSLRARQRARDEMEYERYLFRYNLVQTLGINAENTTWQQRRVLELLLFDEIIERMYGGARNIFAQVWSIIHTPKTRDLDNVDKWASDQQEFGQQPSDIFSFTVEEPDELDYNAFEITTDNYLARKKLIEQDQRVLQIVDKDLDENIADIAIWRNREKDRQTERPRWTLNDEIRFRSSIQKLNVSNDHAVRKLKRIHLKISKLEESLSKKLDTMRSDMDEQRNNNTQIFTYVTVIFLPLGFATGMFSMSEVPAGNMLGNVAITAFGALGITAVLLMAAKTADSAGWIRMPQFTNRTPEDWLETRERLNIMLRRQGKQRKGDSKDDAVERKEEV